MVNKALLMAGFSSYEEYDYFYKKNYSHQNVDNLVCLRCEGFAIDIASADTSDLEKFNSSSNKKKNKSFSK